MRRGVSIYECVTPYASVLLPALEAWVNGGWGDNVEYPAPGAGAYPLLLPIWHRVPVLTLDPVLLRAIKDRGVEPMVYAESSLVAPNVISYESYLRGEQDAKLGAMADAICTYGGRVIVRWDQECGGNWFPWGQRDPQLYKDTFAYVASKMPGNARMYYCNIANAFYLQAYHPGAVAWAHGFDEYSRQAAWVPLKTEWANPIATLNSVIDRPIIVGEFGRLASLSERWQWLDTLSSVTGVWAALYFDMDLRAPGGTQEGVSWLMSPYMRERYI